MKIFHRGNTFVATLLNIIGLTFAFTALYIIIVQVHYDLTYNHGIKDNDRVYLLTSTSSYDEGKYSPYVNRPISEEIIKELPIIETGGIIFPWADYNSQLFLNDDSDPVEIKVSSATKGGIDAIGYEILEGSWEDWKKAAIGVSESYASSLGLKVGDHVKLGNSDFSIAVIYKDLPYNSDFALHDAIVNMGEKDLNSSEQWSYNYFMKFHPGVSEEEIKSALDNHLRVWLKKETGATQEKVEETLKRIGYKFIPLNNIYLDPTVNPVGLKGNKTTTFTLLGIAILIIIIAFINYFNFFFALVPIRLKGINTRKILGSSRVRLVITMIAESVVFIIIALGLSAVLVVIFSHSPYGSLISTSVSIGHHWGMAFITLGTAIVIGIVSSLFPALYITSFNPALGIKGLIGTSQGGEYFRNGLIGFQFTISIILVICAIIINQQRNYMLKYDLGFYRENLYSVNVSQTVALKSETVESKILKEPIFTDITWASGQIVASGRMGWGRTFNGEQITLEVYPVAWNFLQFMNIPVEEGRNYLKSDVENENGLFIVNKEARDKYGFKIGDKFVGHRDAEHPAEVIGFSDNFNYKPLRETGGAFCFYQYGKYPWDQLRQMFVRTAPGAEPREVVEKIIQILKETDPKINEKIIEVESFNKTLDSIYEKEKNLSKLINLFTLLAIVISLMGVFGLVMFDTERRKKEIGIRRVNGASVEEILGMFNMKFIKIIVVSFIVAVPLSWWIISVYLESYAYKTPIYIWVFFVAFLAVLMITTAVVTIRSFRAATANPTKSLYIE